MPVIVAVPVIVFVPVIVAVEIEPRIEPAARRIRVLQIDSPSGHDFRLTDVHDHIVQDVLAQGRT